MIEKLPPEHERLPHGYTNATARIAGAVRKAYKGPGPGQRLAVEHAALTGLHGRFPVPEPLSMGDLELCMAPVPGRPGQEMLDDPDPRMAGLVLAACGRLRRRLSEIDPATVPGLPGTGAHIVHGDFGPQNLLLSPDGTVTALVDWEWAHLGEPLEDLAWAEWLVRTHHPAAMPRLDDMFDAYGQHPPWSQRRAAMLEGCHRCLEFCRRWDDPGAIALWQDRIAATESFQEHESFQESRGHA